MYLNIQHNLPELFRHGRCLDAYEHLVTYTLQETDKWARGWPTIQQIQITRQACLSLKS